LDKNPLLRILTKNYNELMKWFLRISTISLLRLVITRKMTVNIKIDSFWN